MTEVKYVNSLNKEVSFIQANMLPTSGYLHERKWNTSKDNDLTILDISDCTYTVTLTLRGKLEERKRMMDSLCDIVDYDCAVGKPGTLYFGDYSIKCFVITSKSKISSINTRHDVELGIYCPKQEWIREKRYELVMYDDQRETSKTKKFAYTYPFIYSNQKGTMFITNDSLIENDFILRIYGACSNPFVKIGNYVYQVNTTLSSDEYLEIDTKQKTIFSYSKYGEKSNLFPFRSKDRSDFFIKISNGTSQISWNGTFKAELLILEKRGEPKWIQ